MASKKEGRKGGKKGIGEKKRREKKKGRKKEGRKKRKKTKRKEPRKKEKDKGVAVERKKKSRSFRPIGKLTGHLWGQ